MNRIAHACAASLILSLALVGSGQAYAHLQGDMAMDDSAIHIDRENGDVIVTARDHTQAHITRAGILIIDGKNVAVTSQQRSLLLKYADGIDNIERQGMQVGTQAVNMVGDFVGILVSDLLTDTDKNQMDRDVKARAEPLKTAARSLCESVKAQRRLQDDIIDEIPAFKPYAVLDQDNCHVDED
jgi:hypothetical protein